MSDDITLTNILTFSGLCLKGSFGFAGAWLFWRMAVPGFELFVFFAVIWAIGGAICSAKALYQLGKMILRLRKMAAFKRKGTDPKADPVTTDADLRAKGLTR